MFKNVGGKIKFIAEVLMWISWLSFPIYGIVIIIDEDAILKGLIVIIAGVFGSWFSSILLYGFGQLIENSDKIAENIENLLSKNENRKLSEEILMTEEEEFKKWRDEGLITEEEYQKKKINC